MSECEHLARAGQVGCLQCRATPNHLHGKVYFQEASLKGSMAHPLQRLYDACKEMFASSGLPPSPQGLQHVKSLLDAMTLGDLGLDEEILAYANQDRGSTPSVFYLHIHECESFSMGIFYLPPAAVVPLHDHPDMTVLSKLLHGSMHLKSYDWVDPSVQTPKLDIIQGRLAKLVVEQIYTAPCESMILYPTCGGNIHCLTGVTHCAVLDVLVPPYSNKEKWPCTYYRDYVFSSSDPFVETPKTDFNDQSLAWLEIFQPPYGHVRSVRYEPPAIIP